MRSPFRSPSSGLILLSALACVGLARPAGAALSYTGGTATFFHDPDTADSFNQTYTTTVASVPTSTPGSFQHSSTNIQGSGASTAVGAINAVTGSTLGSLSIKSGTGVTQTDPGGANYAGGALLKIDFDLRWTATSPGFGPTALGYVSLVIGGTVPTGGEVDYTATFNFENVTGTKVYRNDAVFNFQRTTAGKFSQTLFNSLAFNPTALVAGDSYRLFGTMSFITKTPEPVITILSLSEPGYGFFGDGEELPPPESELFMSEFSAGVALDNPPTLGTPEPSTAAMLGLAAVALLRRRRRAEA